jgi:anti-sigma regulatory factor (Ser/Thr protein kinase)
VVPGGTSGEGQDRESARRGGGQAGFGREAQSPSGQATTRPQCHREEQMKTGIVLLGSLTVAGRPEQLHAVRAFVSGQLGCDGACTDTAVLLTSELVANAMQHSNSCRGGGSVTVSLIAIRGGIRAEVTDDGGASVPALLRGAGPAELAETGRGLQLVDMLAARWGYSREPSGTVTWFELTEPLPELCPLTLLAYLSEELPDEIATYPRTDICSSWPLAGSRGICGHFIGHDARARAGVALWYFRQGLRD